MVVHDMICNADQELIFNHSSTIKFWGKVILDLQKWVLCFQLIKNHWCHLCQVCHPYSALLQSWHDSFPCKHIKNLGKEHETGCLQSKVTKLITWAQRSGWKFQTCHRQNSHSSWFLFLDLKLSNNNQRQRICCL